MAYEGKTGIGVANHYGPRDTGSGLGVERSTDSIRNISVELTGKSVADGWISPFVVPKGAKMLRAYLAVDDGFSGLTGLSIGERGKETTNGISFTTQLNSAGVYDVTANLDGEWEADTSAVTTKSAMVGMTSTGTVDPTKGVATVTIEYYYKTRDDSNWEPDPDTLPDYSN